MTAFDLAVAVRRLDSGAFAWTVPDGWQQGRGAWGGLVVGALVSAVVESEPETLRTVRSVSVQMMAPALVGEHRISTRCVRHGSAMSTWSASVIDGEGSEVAAMVAILGSPRVADPKLEHAAWGTARMPSVPRPHEVPVTVVGPPMGPVFGQHYRARPLSGVPMGGGPAESVGWIEFADPPHVRAASLLALVDAWWPASLAVLTGMQRVATVNFAANLLVDPATLSADQPLLHQSSVTAAAEGYTSEHRRLWTPDGRLAVDNLQTIVVGS